jgi:hypothetical protein|tara:strand:- start:14253 stop:14606 length:354 start_codon:yes stop_codon:yes gene_type:complete
VPKIQGPFVRLNEDYIQSQTQSVSAQITDLENRLSDVRATPPPRDTAPAIWDQVSRDPSEKDMPSDNCATTDTAVQLMRLIRERKQYLNEFRATRHSWLKRSTPAEDPRKQYRKSYH